MNSEKIFLYYTEGSSDKVYQVALTQETLGWMVRFEYGRRGKPLIAKVKTEVPVRYGVAKKAYDRLVKSKKAEGYTEQSSGVAYADTKNAGQITQFKPQLLNQVNQDEVERLFELEDIWLQTKHDGERRGIIITKSVQAANRRGFATTLQQTVQNACEQLIHEDGSTILDCEDMGDHVVVFDILQYQGRNLVNHSFGHRSLILESLASIVEQSCLTNEIRIDIPIQPQTQIELDNFIKAARNNNEEGVVIRKGRAHYVPGRPHSGGGALKLKFVETATVRVFSIHPTKRSVSVVVWDGKIMVHLGNCTIPPNHDIPEKKSLIEIQYLYAYKNGSLFQPIYKGPRNDLLPSAANVSQLKYKK